MNRMSREKGLNGRQCLDNLFRFRNLKIGQGTYGEVFLAVPKEGARKLYPARHYALKKFYGTKLSMSVIREIALLRETRHENVIGAHHVFFENHHEIFMLLEFAEYDLFDICRYYRRLRRDEIMPTGTLHESGVPWGMMKSVVRQMLTGLAYLHDVQIIMHRDIKPTNILVMGEGPQRGRVKIADFGFARLYKDNQEPLVELDPVVVTCWYRAPELLLGEANYTTGIDVWSAGCIMAELMLLEPLFLCQEEEPNSRIPYNKMQLEAVFRVVGYPEVSAWPEVSSLHFYNRMRAEIRRPQYAARTLEMFITSRVMPVRGNHLDLMNDLLQMNPAKRLTAAKALQHAFFTDLPLASEDVFCDFKEIPYGTRKSGVDVIQRQLETRDRAIAKVDLNGHVAESKAAEQRGHYATHAEIPSASHAAGPSAMHAAGSFVTHAAGPSASFVTHAAGPSTSNAAAPPSYAIRSVARRMRVAVKRATKRAAKRTLDKAIATQPSASQINSACRIFFKNEPGTPVPPRRPAQPSDFPSLSSACLIRMLPPPPAHHQQPYLRPHADWQHAQHPLVIQHPPWEQNQLINQGHFNYQGLLQPVYPSHLVQPEGQQIYSQSRMIHYEYPTHGNAEIPTTRMCHEQPTFRPAMPSMQAHYQCHEHPSHFTPNVEQGPPPWHSHGRDVHLRNPYIGNPYPLQQQDQSHGRDPYNGIPCQLQRQYQSNQLQYTMNRGRWNARQHPYGGGRPFLQNGQAPALNMIPPAAHSHYIMPSLQPLADHSTAITDFHPANKLS